MLLVCSVAADFPCMFLQLSSFLNHIFEMRSFSLLLPCLLLLFSCVRCSGLKFIRDGILIKCSEDPVIGTVTLPSAATATAAAAAAASVTAPLYLYGRAGPNLEIANKVVKFLLLLVCWFLFCCLP